MKDPYVYEDTDVLKNKFNIKDENVLDKAEADFFQIAANKLRYSNFQINSVFDALTIHKQLFSNLYEWAGCPRTINIFKRESLLDGKSIDYVLASYIPQALKELDEEYQITNWEELNVKDKIERICYFVTEFWHIHPFREGNTRTAAMFVYLLAKTVGLHIKVDFLSKNGRYFRSALVLNSLYDDSKPQYILGIVKDGITVKNESSKKYETIEGVEVDKYSYTNHTVDKIKTIKKPIDWKNK